MALDPSIPTIVDPLKSAGYHTAYIGKWHLDGSNAREHYVPPERRAGFDYWMGYENNNNQQECYVFGSDGEEPRRLPGYETNGLTDLLIDHLADHVQEPENYQSFFAVLSVQPPHDPYVPPTDHVAVHPDDVQFRPNVPHVPWIREQAAQDLAGYYGMIENLDWNVGRIREAIKQMGIDRETYLVFFSDHGDMVGCHGQWHKSSPWEESIRIPFIVGRCGGSYNMKTGRCDAVINHVDIAPTTLGLCGIEVPSSMVGHDYSTRCALNTNVDANQEPDSAYLQQIPRKMQAHSVNKAWRGVAMRDGWKYVCMPDHDWLLHNVKEDPYEMANYAHDRCYQAQKERCHARLAQWIADTNDDFELPDIALR